MAMAKLFISERKAAPSLCMSMKISPRRAVVVLAGAEIHLVAADGGLLRVALAAVRQLGALVRLLCDVDDALDDLLDDAFGDRGACAPPSAGSSKFRRRRRLVARHRRAPALFSGCDSFEPSR